MSTSILELSIHAPTTIPNRVANHCDCKTHDLTSVNVAIHGELFSNNRLKSKTNVTLNSLFIKNVLREPELRNSAKCKPKTRNTCILSELGGQYEENFDDIDKHILDCFTIKAIKTLLVQLHEMNPPTYAWFYDFVASNKPKDSKLFIRKLVVERQDLAERVMITRLHLFNKWVKKYDHANMHQLIADQNLDLLRERLSQTAVFASEDMETTHPESS